MLKAKSEVRGVVYSPGEKQDVGVPATPEKQQNNKANAVGRSVVNPEIEARGSDESTLKKLIDINEQYLMERIKISDVPKPAKYSHKMPSKTGHSQYNQRFGSANRSYNFSASIPQRNKTGSVMKLPNQPVSDYCSTYHMEYKKKEQKDGRVPEKKKKYQREEAPHFTETSYQRDYQEANQPVTESAKRAEVRLMGGGPLATSTTYKHNYRSKTETAQRPQPVMHKNHKIFLTLADIPKESSYKQSFTPNPRKQVKQASCKPEAKYRANPNKNKYCTEYSQVFIKRALPEQREFEYFSHQQLKDYVMTILDE